MNIRIIKNPEQYLEFLCCDPIQDDGGIIRALFGLTRRYRIEFRLEYRGVAGEKITMNAEEGVLRL